MLVQGAGPWLVERANGQAKLLADSTDDKLDGSRSLVAAEHSIGNPSQKVYIKRHRRRRKVPNDSEQAAVSPKDSQQAAGSPKLAKTPDMEHVPPCAALVRTLGPVKLPSADAPHPAACRFGAAVQSAVGAPLAQLADGSADEVLARDRSYRSSSSLDLESIELDA